MLAGQSEKDEKSTAQEVSIETLTSNSNPDHLEAENMLRRRRIINRTETRNELEYSPSNLDTQTRVNNSTHKFEKSPKTIKYPKIMSSYPKILPSNKIHPQEMTKSKKSNSNNSKPPLAHAPIFLKCNVTKKLSPRKIIDRDLPLKTTDLDIQLKRLKFEAFSMSSSSSDSERRPSFPSDNVGQSLNQYCNFDEKKIVKVAPHIRRKDVICDTVDAWSRGHDAQVNNDLSRCKPLVFGGTYPIDFPLRNRNHEKLSGTIYSPQTFQIDAPMSYESEEL